MAATAAARSSATTAGAGSVGASAHVLTPVSTRAKGAPRRLASNPSVSTRSPTTMPTGPSRRAMRSATGWAGFPATSGLRPAAAVTNATNAPAPGTRPSGVG